MCCQPIQFVGRWQALPASKTRAGPIACHYGVLPSKIRLCHAGIAKLCPANHNKQREVHAHLLSNCNSSPIRSCWTLADACSVHVHKVLEITERLPLAMQVACHENIRTPYISASESETQTPPLLLLCTAAFVTTDIHCTRSYTYR